MQADWRLRSGGTDILKKEKLNVKLFGFAFSKNRAGPQASEVGDFLRKAKKYNPQPNQSEQIPESADHSEIAQREYKKIACAHCGLIIPKNEAHAVNEERPIGRSGTSRRTTFSFGIRSFRESFSRYSGRRYYRQQTVYLCKECFDADVTKKRTNALIKFGALAALVITLVVLGSQQK